MTKRVREKKTAHAQTPNLPGESAITAAAIAARRQRQNAGKLTHEERSAEMRLRLMEATLASLEINGYSGSSISAIAALAGVSRGAIQHHYPEKDYLVAGALELAAIRIQENIKSTAETMPPGNERVEMVLDRFWNAMLEPPMPALLDIRIAARTNAMLQSMLLPLEHNARNHQRELIGEAFGDEIARDANFIPRVDALLAALRGLAFQLGYGWDSREIEPAWNVAKKDFIASFARNRATADTR